MVDRHYVYFISAVSQPPRVKVGESTDPEQRLKALQTGSPYELRLHDMLIPLETKAEAVELEKMLHASLRIHRLRGEWFGCDAETAVKTASSVLFGEFELDDAGTYRKIDK